MPSAKSNGGTADARYVIVLEAVLRRQIPNWSDSFRIRSYAVAIAQGAPERIPDLQRISWHSEVVKAESDMDGSSTPNDLQQVDKPYSKKRQGMCIDYVTTDDGGLSCCSI